ncbi:Legume-like lectin family protein [Histomonas meleagridis]|uniref:Legume-like lectin family protein n=1 Tax=Histomonas meleagridis TaxID=135588 RepID=UPI00355A0000|nr:Legume-like lectin family protein [Histomonas meleagridis]KAH0800227.1 Legume-like lectin family protein [Histomonas meleagridis]
MLCFLLPLAYSFEVNYSLAPPMTKTDVHEMGQWSMQGVAVNMKKFIRLTSNINNAKSPADYGAICNRVPTTFRDWLVEFEISAKNGGLTGGEDFFIFYTEEVCPIYSETSHGIILDFKTSQTDVDNLTPIYLISNLNTTIAPQTRTELRNKNVPTRFRLTKRGEKITLEQFQDYKFRMLISEDVPGLPPFGYFSVMAVSDEFSDDNDLHSFMTLALSSVIEKEYDPSLSNKNRKIIDYDFQERKKKKYERRLNMPTVRKYITEATEKNNKLFDGQYNLIDAFRIINETISRLDSSVSLESLKKFVETVIKDSILEAAKTISFGFEQFSEIRSETQELWSGLRSNLLEMNLETKQEMEKIKSDFKDLAELMLIDDNGIDIRDLDIPKARENQSTVSKVLIVIMIIEVLSYVLFFVVKHRRTSGFKKID